MEKVVTVKLEIEVNLSEEKAQKLIEAFHSNTDICSLVNTQNENTEFSVESCEVVEAVIHEEEESVSIIWSNNIKIVLYTELWLSF